MNSWTRERPMTSSVLYPIKRIAHCQSNISKRQWWVNDKDRLNGNVVTPLTLFHTFTHPSVSTPKIGAFAVSISFEYSLSWAKRPVISCPMPLEKQRYSEWRACTLCAQRRSVLYSPTTPITLPCSSLRVVALSRTSKRTPPFVIWMYGRNTERYWS